MPDHPITRINRGVQTDPVSETEIRRCGFDGKFKLNPEICSERTPGPYAQPKTFAPEAKTVAKPVVETFTDLVVFYFVVVFYLLVATYNAVEGYVPEIDLFLTSQNKFGAICVFRIGRIVILRHGFKWELKFIGKEKNFKEVIGINIGNIVIMLVFVKTNRDL